MTLTNLPQSTPGTPAARSRAHVVFDATTGAILHVHYTVEFEGGAPQSEDPKDRARRLASLGVDVDAEVVEVDPSDVNHHRPVKIDLATRRVVSA
ncbi:MAG TPA: hypothetical protein VKQ54_01505 [Caulobacteraceae bacterium]|nr:hypothetical protein [Caulobacteraceae bacterium]